MIRLSRRDKRCYKQAVLTVTLMEVVGSSRCCTAALAVAEFGVQLNNVLSREYLPVIVDNRFPFDGLRFSDELRFRVCVLLLDRLRDYLSVILRLFRVPIPN